MRHSDTSVPTNGFGQKYSLHTWRANCVKHLASYNAWRAFIKLRDASETARYLVSPDPQKPKQAQFLTQPAYEVFGEREIKELIQELQTLKNGMRVEMVVLIGELGIQSQLDKSDLSNVASAMLRFSSKINFLQTGRQFLQGKLSDSQMTALEQCMQSKGYHFAS